MDLSKVTYGLRELEVRCNSSKRREEFEGLLIDLQRKINKVVLEEDYEDYKIAFQFVYEEPQKNSQSAENYINYFTEDRNEVGLIVDKIETMGYWVNRSKGQLTIVDSNSTIVVMDIKDALSTSNKKLYSLCIDFIKLYNTNGLDIK
jgi:hypothetical protein